jgi:hypothetical protein
MSVENLQLMLSIIGLLIVGIDLPLLYLQLRGLQKSILTATHAAMYHQAAEFRAHLMHSSTLPCWATVSATRIVRHSTGFPRWLLKEARYFASTCPGIGSLTLMRCTAS